MLFRKKQALRKEYDAALLELMRESKENWEKTKRVEESADGQEDLLFAKVKLEEAKYFYLYKEARKRAIRGSLDSYRK